jgi:hypothetical protein
MGLRLRRRTPPTMRAFALPGRPGEPVVYVGAPSPRDVATVELLGACAIVGVVLFCVGYVCGLVHLLGP